MSISLTRNIVAWFVRRLQAKGRVINSYVEFMDLFLTQDTDVISQASIILDMFKIVNDRKARWDRYMQEGKKEEDDRKGSGGRQE